MIDTSLPDPLAGRYTVLEVLGEGSHGRVLAARDTQLGRTVALKLLRDPGAKEALPRRFLREARLLARVQHPSLIRILDQGVCRSGELFLVLEWIAGGDLERRRRDSGGRCPPDQVLAWGVPIAAALACLHHEGVLHRDVKLANVLLRPGGEPVLADLGLARGLEGGEPALTASGAILGTPATMAPELWRGDPASPASDQFAWGACLAELLYGVPVWRGTTLREIFEEVRSDGPLLAGPLPPGAPRTLTVALQRALERDPGRRFATMEDFGAALGAAVAQEPEHGAPSKVLASTRILPAHAAGGSSAGATREGVQAEECQAVPHTGPQDRPAERSGPPTGTWRGRGAALGALPLVLALLWWWPRELSAPEPRDLPVTAAAMDRLVAARTRLTAALEPLLSRHRGTHGEPELPRGAGAANGHRLALEPWLLHPAFPDQCRELFQAYLNWNQAMAQARGWRPGTDLAANGLELLSGPMLEILPHVLFNRRLLAKSGARRVSGTAMASPLAEARALVPQPDLAWEQVRASAEGFVAELGADLEVQTPDVHVLRAAIASEVWDGQDPVALSRLFEDLHGDLLAEDGGAWGRLFLTQVERVAIHLGPRLPCALRHRCLGERAAWIETHGASLGPARLLAARLRVLREDVSAIDCLGQGGVWQDTALFDATMARLRQLADWKKIGLMLVSELVAGLSLVRKDLDSPGFRHRWQAIHRERETLRALAAAKP